MSESSNRSFSFSKRRLFRRETIDDVDRMRFNSYIEMAHDLGASISSQFRMDSPVLDCNENTFEPQLPSQLMEKSVAEPSGLAAPIDLRPTDVASQRLEYSYRPLDEIEIVGPNYWNFKARSKQLIRNNNDGRKKKKVRRARQIVPNLIDASSSDDDFIKITCREQRKIRTVNRQWNPKRLLLPRNCGIDRNLFNSYQFRPGIDLSVERAPVNFGIDQNGSFLEVVETKKHSYNLMKVSFVCTADGE